MLVTGGSSGAEATNSNSASPVYPAEMWDPATNTWTTLAGNTVYRGYHATALLQPDGRVLSGGGDHGGTSVELFSPPYLFRGARPTISAAPASVGYGQTFFVGTPDAAGHHEGHLDPPLVRDALEQHEPADQPPELHAGHRAA